MFHDENIFNEITIIRDNTIRVVPFLAPKGALKMQMSVCVPALNFQRTPQKPLEGPPRKSQKSPKEPSFGVKAL